MSSEEDDHYTLSLKEDKGDDQIKPCIIVFPYNFPTSSIITNPNETKWMIGENQLKKTAVDKSIVCETNKIIYKSRSRNHLNKSTYVLGLIGKKRKNEISLYEIAGLFPMNQEAKKIKRQEMLKETTGKVYQEDKTEGADKLELMMNFGTSKGKKVAENIKSNLLAQKNISIEESKEILENLREQAEEMQKNQIDDVTKHNNYMMEILPKFDLQETDVKKIFDFESGKIFSFYF